MKRNTVLMKFNLPKPIKEKLEIYAKEYGLTMTHVVTESVIYYLENKGTQSK